jgi:membrane associated rhomboid family serine protease
LFRKVTAKWVLGFWFVSGLLYDWVLVEVLLDESSGVAWMAHVGGFIFGCIFGLIWRKQVPVGRPEAPGPEPATAWIR